MTSTRLLPVTLTVLRPRRCGTSMPAPRLRPCRLWRRCRPIRFVPERGKKWIGAKWPVSGCSPAIELAGIILARLAATESRAATAVGDEKAAVTAATARPGELQAAGAGSGSLLLSLASSLVRLPHGEELSAAGLRRCFVRSRTDDQIAPF